MKTTLAALLALGLLCGTASAAPKKSFWEILRDKSPRSDGVVDTFQNSAS